ncbi:hypothetical protein AMATHDRAFT_74495 [Amanita thiersii Skay4041]|uniref:Cytoplasmic protein n=1 Tax=Amanita thiersii Skay4041 TaxID=703135 RepID=A0A2A9NLX7_9AGAR|nr:hypothetical protein AMATHDRAFT_74495 [Amanita thiersii Skay4041]
MWEPLPLIVYGYAIHPLSPNRREARLSTRNRLSTVTEASTESHPASRDVVSLEVGDEVYAFEKYTPSSREPIDGVWYRGYVVTTTRRPPVNWSMTDSSLRSSIRTEEPQQVFIGIFPASHIFIRDELADAEGRLMEIAATFDGTTNGITSASEPQRKDMSSISVGTMKDDYEPSIRLMLPSDHAGTIRGIPMYSTSVRSVSPANSHDLKPLPPRPSLKSGDDTASGIEQPIVDEIASALREWHMLMFQYLARRDYNLFHTVRQHIEALHLGRRQLLAQTLNAEETNHLRRECVLRLVRANIVQGLDVIVRHPSWGGLVTVDVGGEIENRSWISAVRMYSMQVNLAYLNVASDAAKSYPPDHHLNGFSLAPASSAFPEFAGVHSKKLSRSQGCLDSFDACKSSKGTTKFYHVYLDLRAFVASLCSPGETAELFFSLYRKQGTQFVTEDFCAILNHNGVLARNPSSRIRTLFTDLVLTDVQDPIYLVCRIIRNGSLKLGSYHSDSPARFSDSGRSDNSVAVQPSDAGNSLMSVRGTQANDINGCVRRPFGCAVLELTQISKMVEEKSDASPLKEHTMPIYAPMNEASFSMIHQSIINNNTKEYERSPRADILAVSIKIFRGDVQTIVRENTSLLQDTPHTLRLGFPDVVFPGDQRNELYIKLWSGDFSSSHNGSSRLSVANFARAQMSPGTNNIEVAIEVRDQHGKLVENSISQGSGEPMSSQFRSMVFQRCNEPTFGELIKIALPFDVVPEWHLFFTFRNRMNRERPRGQTEVSEKPFAFAFQPLFLDGRSFVEDGSHTLILYKAEKASLLTTDQYLSSPSCLSAGQKLEHTTIPSDMFRLAPPIRDTLTIRSSLCSTKFTQNSVLLSLLNWEKVHDKELISAILTKFTFVGEGEIVKFLRDIFDSLFGILISLYNQAGEMDLLVFNALVTVLGIVQDRRFSNFQPVLDVYIEKHFSCAAAATHIIHSMNRLLANPTAPETASPLRAALKVWHYIFKFIARSRELQKVKEVGMGGGATAEHLETTFKRELRSHLSEVTHMMSTTTPPSIIGTQTIALQHFTSILPELAKMFSTVELVSIATSFANAVTGAKGKLVIWKLIMYLQIIKGFLFDNSQSRPLLVEAVVIWIKPHFGRYDEYAHTTSNDSESARDAARVAWLESIRLCVTIIAVMLDKLQQKLVDPDVITDRHAFRQEQENMETLLSLLPRLLESFKEFNNSASWKAIENHKSPTTVKSIGPVTFPDSYPFTLLSYLPDAQKTQSGLPSNSDSESLFSPGLGEISVVLLVLILSSPTHHILDFLQSSLDIEGRERFLAFLSQFFKVAISILENNSFPKTWLNVNILAHKVLMKMMEPITRILQKEFIPPQDSEAQFNAALWKECLYMLLLLLSSDQLVIEEFSPQKRRAVWRLAGDVRGEGAAILLNLWQALGWSEIVLNNNDTSVKYGGYQLYLHSLVGQVVNLCLSHHDQLRSNAVQILYSMIISEYHQSGHFDGIEHELVTRLDSLFMSDSKGDDISRAFFIGQLRHLFDTTNVDEQLRHRVSNFLDSVDLFLELLLNVRALPEGEEYADDRVIATLRLMNFIRRIGRDEIYIKYVHQLVNMHLQSQNYVEAALTLKLHSDLHEWDLNTFVPPMEDLGLPQQSQFHRKETLCLLILDYLGKGKAWEKAIEICRELAYQHAEVTFNYGRLSEILRHEATLLEHIVSEQRYYPDYYRVTFYGNFPAAIRDKKFIYRGYEWEKYGAFCERMLSKHPGAQLLKTVSDPPVDIRFGNDQYIQCTAVTPVPDRSLPVFSNPEVPLSIRTYYEHCGINLFSSSRQVKKIARDGSEEIWVEKTYLTTEEPFPTVLRRSEVLSVEVVEISPLENALNEVEEKTKELANLKTKYEALAKTSQPVSTNALAMSLNGAVDAPLHTGIASYRQLFFDSCYATRYPERVEVVEKLRVAIDNQVRVIDSCLKLHGHLCPPEFIPFHETLEKFFKKNFRDEIKRLAMDGSSETDTISPSLRSRHNQSDHEQAVHRSVSTSSNLRRGFVIPPLNLGRSAMTPPPLSPQLSMSPDNVLPPAKQTILQRHLAHLARHGMTGVSSAPENGGSDSFSVESLHNSFVNVGTSASTPQVSGTSVAASTIGSIGSFGSLKGRLSRFGSLNFSRRNASHS